MIIAHPTRRGGRCGGVASEICTQRMADKHADGTSDRARRRQRDKTIMLALALFAGLLAIAHSFPDGAGACFDGDPQEVQDFQARGRPAFVVNIVDAVGESWRTRFDGHRIQFGGLVQRDLCAWLWYVSHQIAVRTFSVVTTKQSTRCPFAAVCPSWAFFCEPRSAVIKRRVSES